MYDENEKDLRRFYSWSLLKNFPFCVAFRFAPRALAQHGKHGVLNSTLEQSEKRRLAMITDFYRIPSRSLKLKISRDDDEITSIENRTRLQKGSSFQ